MLETFVKVKLWGWLLDIRSTYGSLSYSTRPTHHSKLRVFPICSPVLLNTHSLKVNTLPAMNSKITPKIAEHFITAAVTAHGVKIFHHVSRTRKTM
jgi:hypothetical protein